MVGISVTDSTAAQGATFVNQYIVVKTLGRGAYGKVKLCLDSQDHELYAIKIINNARSLRKGRVLGKHRCALCATAAGELLTGGLCPWCRSAACALPPQRPVCPDGQLILPCK